MNAVIISGVADADAARTAARAAAPNGEVRIPPPAAYEGDPGAPPNSRWDAIQLSAGDISPTIVWCQGDVVIPSLGDQFRGA